MAYSLNQWCVAEHMGWQPNPSFKASTVESVLPYLSGRGRTAATRGRLGYVGCAVRTRTSSDLPPTPKEGGWCFRVGRNDAGQVARVVRQSAFAEILRRGASQNQLLAQRGGVG